MLIPFFSNKAYNQDVNKAAPSSRKRAGKRLQADATLAAVLQALSDPIRLHVVRCAAARERPCCEFDLDLPKATLSHHFKVLREAGIIAVRIEGTRRFTSLNRQSLDKRFPGLIDAVLGSTK
jgi:DNA-binding transcriptional ArsR family regulator